MSVDKMIASDLLPENLRRRPELKLSMLFALATGLNATLASRQKLPMGKQMLMALMHVTFTTWHVSFLVIRSRLPRNGAVLRTSVLIVVIGVFNANVIGARVVGRGLKGVFSCRRAGAGCRPRRPP